MTGIAYYQESTLGKALCALTSYGFPQACTEDIWISCISSPISAYSCARKERCFAETRRWGALSDREGPSLSFWLLFPVLSPCSYFLTWMLLKVPFSFSLSSLPSPTGMYVPTSTIPTLCERLLIFLFSTSSAFHNSRGTSLRVFQEEYSFSHLLPSSQSTPGTQLSVQHMFCE